MDLKIYYQNKIINKNVGVGEGFHPPS
jgi:hypothetical protein